MLDFFKLSEHTHPTCLPVACQTLVSPRMDGKCVPSGKGPRPDAVTTVTPGCQRQDAVPTKLQDILMGFVHVADELLEETVGKSLLNRRGVQFQVLEPSVRTK